MADGQQGQPSELRTSCPVLDLRALLPPDDPQSGNLDAYIESLSPESGSHPLPCTMGTSWVLANSLLESGLP